MHTHNIPNISSTSYSQICVCILIIYSCLCIYIYIYVVLNTIYVFMHNICLYIQYMYVLYLYLYTYMSLCMCIYNIYIYVLYLIHMYIYIYVYGVLTANCCLSACDNSISALVIGTHCEVNNGGPAGAVARRKNGSRATGGFRGRKRCVLSHRTMTKRFGSSGNKKVIPTTIMGLIVW